MYETVRTIIEDMVAEGLSNIDYIDLYSETNECRFGRKNHYNYRLDSVGYSRLKCALNILEADYTEY